MDWRVCIYFVLAATCYPLSSAIFDCKADCNITSGVKCGVKVSDPDCLSTAVFSRPVWPGEPENVVLNQYVPTPVSGEAYAGINLNWKMPHDSSAQSVEGFEVNIMLAGSEVAGIQKCYVFTLTRVDNQSAISLPDLVKSIFTLQCRVPATAESVVIQLYSLPKPQAERLRKRVIKYVKIKDIPQMTQPPNPCNVDPQIDVVQSQKQLIVELRNWSDKRKYHISLMMGPYEYGEQVIQPSNSSAKQSAVFEDPDLIKPGLCYSFWALMEECKTYWSRYTQEPFCVKEVTTAVHTSLRQNDTENIPAPPRDPSAPAQDLSMAMIIVLCSAVIGVLALGALVLIFIYKRHNNLQAQPCPYSHVPGQDAEDVFPDPIHPNFDTESGHEDVLNPGPLPPNMDITSEELKIQRLILVYCTTKETRECVREFKSCLEEVFPRDVEVVDFMDDDGMERGELAWIQELRLKAECNNSRVLLIYTEGIFHMLKAKRNNMYYKNYENSELNGESFVKFHSAIQDILFRSNRGRQIVVSLGSKLNQTSFDRFTSFLWDYSGVKFQILSEENEQIIIHNNNLKEFFKTLNVANVEDIVNRANAQAEPLLKAAKKMLREQNGSDWFVKKYGPPEKMSLANIAGTSSLSGSMLSFSSSLTPTTLSEQDRCSIGNSQTVLQYQKCPSFVNIIPPNNSDSDLTLNTENYDEV